MSLGESGQQINNWEPSLHPQDPHMGKLTSTAILLYFFFLEWTELKDN